LDLKVKDSKPFYQCQYKLSRDDANECHRQIEQMAEENVIEMSTSSYYNSPVFVVNKADGISKRFICDLRKCNAAVEPFNLELGDMSQMLNDMAAQHAEYYSTFDLFSSFWQVPLSKKSRPLTSFTDPLSGLRYQWTVSPFGLANSVSALVMTVMSFYLGLYLKIIHISTLMTLLSVAGAGPLVYQILKNFYLPCK
jgi:hypothetical protein